MKLNTVRVELVLGAGCAIVACALALTQSFHGHGLQPTVGPAGATAPAQKDNPGAAASVAGASVGRVDAPPNEVRAYVTAEVAPPVGYAGPVDIGRRLDGSIAWRGVPGHPKYRWAHLNDERVVVDDSRTVVAIYVH